MSAQSLKSFLITAAKQKRVRIILPESDHAEVLTAAINAHRDGIADCILLGAPAEIRRRVADLQLSLPDSLTLLSAAAATHAPALAKLRAHKGLDESAAAAWLQADSVAMAAMLVREKYAAGVVAGAATASATVLRAFLQIIGKKSPLVSSFFLLAFKEKTLLFADCALNVRPTAEELADIAVHSAASAKLFGLSPIVGMLSYASGDSAEGAEVSQIGAATVRARQQLGDIPVLGPIQYDAAVSPKIAAAKVPQWANAGRVNVLVFPNLAAGNIAYKAVQQAANIVAVGPLMQGLSAPANDLSRGATAEDIYYTIAATAVQAAGQTIPA